MPKCRSTSACGVCRSTYRGSTTIPTYVFCGHVHILNVHHASTNDAKNFAAEKSSVMLNSINRFQLYRNFLSGPPAKNDGDYALEEKSRISHGRWVKLYGCLEACRQVVQVFRPIRPKGVNQTHRCLWPLATNEAISIGPVALSILPRLCHSLHLSASSLPSHCVCASNFCVELCKLDR